MSDPRINPNLTAPLAPLPPLAADAPPECSTSDCGKPATFSYTWDWGQAGLACSQHASLLQQTADNLQRKVMVAPLPNAAPAPLLRDERIQLTAKSMVLEAELAEAKGRGLDLYRENIKLTAGVQAVTVRGRELDAQLKDASLTIAQLRSDLAARDAEHGDLVDEVSRLRVLAQFLPPAATQAAGVPVAPEPIPSPC